MALAKFLLSGRRPPLGALAYSREPGPDTGDATAERNGRWQRALGDANAYIDAHSRDAVGRHGEEGRARQWLCVIGILAILLAAGISAAEATTPICVAGRSAGRSAIDSCRRRSTAACSAGPAKLVPALGLNDSRRMAAFSASSAGYGRMSDRPHAAFFRRCTSGGTASSARLMSAASSGSTVWPSLPSRRIETVRSAASLRPTTSRAGTLASECSRTL